MIVAKKNLDKNIIVYQSDNIKELQRKLEEICFEYLQKLQISPEIYYRSRSKKYGKCPYGYFVIPQHNKLTIYYKNLNKGYIYNSDNVCKIISFLLIEPQKNKFELKNYDANETFEKTKYKISCWNKIHESIIKDK
jgi:hypothetical protein